MKDPKFEILYSQEQMENNYLWIVKLYEDRVRTT